MKIVITGALGHIGSRFIHSIKPGQYSEVVLMDNMLTQRYPSLFDLPAGVPFRFFEEDILKADLKTRLAGAHAVIHLAAITDAASSFGKADEVERVNYEGTKLVARACIDAGARLIALSSTSVYGTADEIVDENTPTEGLKPQSPYAESKLKGEQLLKSLAAEGLRSISCRFGTIFGASPGMRFHTAVNKFCWQAVMGQPISVWRTALNQKRPYLDLGDAVRAFEHILAKDLFDNGIYNVLTVNSTPADFVEILKKHVPSLEVRLTDAAIMNQLSYNVRCDKFKATGFEFRGSPEQAIGETLGLLRNATGK